MSVKINAIQIMDKQAIMFLRLLDAGKNETLNKTLYVRCLIRLFRCLGKKKHMNKMSVCRAHTFARREKY